VPIALHDRQVRAEGADDHADQRRESLYELRHQGTRLVVLHLPGEDGALIQRTHDDGKHPV